MPPADLNNPTLEDLDEAVGHLREDAAEGDRAEGARILVRLAALAEENRDPIVEAGAVPGLVTIVTNHKDFKQLVFSGTAAEWATRAIGYLAMGNSAARAEILTESGAIPALVSYSREATGTPAPDGIGSVTAEWERDAAKWALRELKAQGQEVTAEAASVSESFAGIPLEAKEGSQAGDASAAARDDTKSSTAVEQDGSAKAEDDDVFSESGPGAVTDPLLGHVFLDQYFSKPTTCAICKKMVMGLTAGQQKGCRCSQCKADVHRKCVLQKLSAANLSTCPASH